MKLGLQLGYWGAQAPTNHAELVAEAEAAGFDTVFTAEAWGSDAYTPLAWGGRGATRVRLGHAGNPAWGGTRDHQETARHVGHPAIGADADGVCEGGADAGPPLRRAAHPRPRRLGA